MAESNFSVPSRDGHPGHFIRLGGADSGLGKLFIEAEKLVSSGELVYLPSYAKSPDIMGWWYPGEDFGQSFSEDWFELQVKRIAQDIYVSQRLGCGHVFPHLLDTPVEITRLHKRNAVGMVLAGLKIPSIEACSFDVRSKEERPAFRALQKAIVDATDALASTDPDANAERCVAKVQREIIDEPVAKLTEKIKRLERYYYFRAAGYGVTSTVLLITTFVAPAAAGVVSGGLGSLTLLKDANYSAVNQ